MQNVRGLFFQSISIIIAFGTWNFYLIKFSYITTYNHPDQILWSIFYYISSYTHRNHHNTVEDTHMKLQLNYPTQFTYHWWRFFPTEHFPEISNNFPGVVVGNLCTPPCSNTISSIYQDHWNDRDVPLRLNFLVIIIVVLQKWSIMRMEDMLGQLTERKLSYKELLLEKQEYIWKEE